MNDEILNALRVIYKDGKGDSSIAIKLLDEIERLRGALAVIPNMPWSMVNAHVRQALEGETK